MPSMTCSHCGFVVRFLDDFVGVLQCPSCSEVLGDAGSIPLERINPSEEPLPALQPITAPEPPPPSTPSLATPVPASAPPEPEPLLDFPPLPSLELPDDPEPTSLAPPSEPIPLTNPIPLLDLAPEEEEQPRRKRSYADDPPVEPVLIRRRGRREDSDDRPRRRRHRPDSDAAIEQPRVPENCPPGVRGAASIWVVCGYLGLLLNTLLLAGFCLVAADNIRMRDPAWAVLMSVILFFSTIAFYGVIIGMGKGVYAGRLPWVQIPAWFVLFSSSLLLFVNVFAGTGFFVTQVQPAFQSRTSINGLPPMAVAVGGCVLAGLFVLVHLMLYGSSVCLLWQSGPYTNWANPVRGYDEKHERTPYPVSVGFAGIIWITVAVVGTLLAGLASVETITTWPPPTREYSIIAAGLAMASVLPLLIFLPLGVTHWKARLPSTLAVNGLLLVLLMATLLVLFLILVASLDPSPWLPRDRRYKDVMRLCLVGGILLNLVAMVASVAGMIGDGAYRIWVRQKRGWRV